ncbi:MAG: hypothetical protein KC621_04725, partial [Myxococcales bacterium]|nr:hypothetical protein [Myxococcales bacterium]
MLPLLPALTASAATTPPPWRPAAASSLMVQIHSEGKAEGQTLQAMISIPTGRAPSDFLANLDDLVAFDELGGQLACAVEAGANDTIVWVRMPIPDSGDHWIWLDWSGVAQDTAVFADYFSVHHFEPAALGSNAVDGSHTAVVGGTSTPGTLGYQVLLGNPSETISIPYAQLLSTGASGWTITTAIGRDLSAGDHAVLTGGSAWRFRSPTMPEISF